MLCLLMVLLRRHHLLGQQRWLAPLTFLLAGQIGWFIAVLSPAFSHTRYIGHALSLDGQLLTALFLVEGGRRDRRRRGRRLYVLKCIGPLLFVTVYGLYIETRQAYAVIALGSLILLAPALSVPRRRPLAIGAAGVMILATALALMNQERIGAYGVLTSAFGFATYRLWITLPRRTLGRFAILCSLSVWTLSFATHPFVLGHRPWQELADNIWDLQPIFFSMGVMMLLLEEQVVSTRHLAFHDQLTDLPNRRLLDGRIEEALDDARRSGTPVGILLFDLNGFKAINDTYGHPVGDLVLVETSRRIASLLNSAETLARLGGDEFVLVSTRAGSEERRIHFEAELQQAVSVPLRFNECEVSVTASFGCAVFPQDVLHIEQKRLTPALLHIADQRMYANKMLHRAVRATTALDHGILSS